MIFFNKGLEQHTYYLRTFITYDITRETVLVFTKGMPGILKTL